MVTHSSGHFKLFLFLSAPGLGFKTRKSLPLPNTSSEVWGTEHGGKVLVELAKSLHINKL